MTAAVRAAEWVFPFGWLYKNVTGNLVASAVTFTAGVFAGRAGLRNLHAKLDIHHETHRDLLAQIFDAVHPPAGGDGDPAV